MKNKLKNIIFYFNIFFQFLIFQKINCKKNYYNHEGKCVYIRTNTGSKIINFHKFSVRENILNLNDKDSNEKKIWSINLCNDTTYEIYNNSELLGYDSQIVYTDEKRNYKLTGPFLKAKNEKEKNKLISNDDKYIYYSHSGELCNNGKNYNTTFIYEKNKVKDKEYAEIKELPNISQCNNILEISYDEDYSIDYLILQIILNDAYIFSAILFILLGLYLSFLSFKFLILTKIIICAIFGQIFIFTFEILIIGNSTSLKEYICILMIFLGLLIGGVMAYYSLKNNRLYLILLSFSSGFVNGIFVFDMCFIGTSCRLSPAILVDVILIFSISFIALIQIVPKNSIYYPPVIGSYIFIRGISLIVYNLSGKVGYRDLQLLLYLLRLHEYDLVDQYLDKDFKYFWIYVVFNAILLALSEIFNYIINKNIVESFIDDETEENDNNRELIGKNLDINEYSSRTNSDNI
jgi:hypothetical protein